MARPRSAASSSNGANLGFEARLWAAADALRNNMDAADRIVPPTPHKIGRPYKKEEREERQNVVNDDVHPSEEHGDEKGPPERLGEVIK